MRFAPLCLSLVALGCAATPATALDASADVRAVPDASADEPFRDAQCAAAPTADALSAAVSLAADRAALTAPLVARSRAWFAAEQTHLDADTGLLLDTLDLSATWSTRDTAADIYPFFTWGAYLFDPAVFEGATRRVLSAERALTLAPTTGLLPWDYDVARRTRVLRDANDPHFGAAEYAKDGLTPIVELVGRGPFADRMGEIELDSFAYGRWNTAAGTLPIDNLEVNGDHLQTLPRLYAMTRDVRYLRLAERIAEQYLVNDGYRPVDLRDHGCEIIGGFALLYAVEREAGSPLADRYEPLLRNMIDYIVDYGLTPDGMMPNAAHTAVRGPVEAPRGTLSDNWGQNYVAFLVYAQLAGHPEYAAYADRALRGVSQPAYDDYPWEGTVIDGLADAMEGAMYLLAYRDVPEGERWLDAQSRWLAARPWDANKFGANANRTATLYVRSRTRGAWLRPWTEGTSLGAAPVANGVVVSVQSDRAWNGRVTFDTPRYRETLGFTADHPRMNYLPAYFVAESAARYRVTDLTARTAPVELTGAALREGLALTVSAGGRVDLLIERIDCG